MAPLHFPKFIQLNHSLHGSAEML